MPKVFITKTWGAEQLTFPDLNLNFQDVIDGINNINGDQLLDKIIESRHFSDDTNPFKVLGELLCREAVPFGYDFLGCTGFTVSIAAGRAYVLKDSDITIPKELVPVINDISRSATLSDNSDNYIDLDINNTLHVLPVVLDGVAPSVIQDAVRLMVVTVVAVVCTDSRFLADRDVFPDTGAGARPDNLYIISAHEADDWKTLINFVSGNVKDSTGIFDISIKDPFQFDVDLSGKNGLETGATKDANQLYHLYLINDQNGAQVTAAIASKSEVSPNLPGGFNIFRKISSFYLDKDKAIMPFFMYNDRYEHLSNGHLIVGEQPIMAALGASWRGQNFGTVDLTNFVPKTAKVAILGGHMRLDATLGRNVSLHFGIPTYSGNVFDDSAFASSATFNEDPDSLVPWTHAKHVLTIGGGSTQNEQNMAVEDAPCMGTDKPEISYGLFQNNSSDPTTTLHLALRNVGYVDSFVEDERDQ